MKAHLAKAMFFEAAHRNPNGDAKQQRLHGHSYRVDLLAAGELDPAFEWVVDYGEIKALFAPLDQELDHADLNAIPGLEYDATLEGLRAWIEGSVGQAPEWFGGVRVSILGDLAFRPLSLPPDPAQTLPRRLRFSFEAAQSLPQLAAGHPCRNLHGHSYTVEVAAADLEALDRDLAALYDALDHRYLNDIEGLASPTCERICQWIWNWLAEHGDAPQAVVVQETPSARCLYFGE